MPTKDLESWMNEPFTAFNELCDQASDEDLHDADQSLAMVMCSAAWRRGYIVTRRNGLGHDAAVKRANKDLAEVRATIGYSYPEAAAIHV
jgi:hypothetical protein